MLTKFLRDIMSPGLCKSSSAVYEQQQILPTSSNDEEMDAPSAHVIRSKPSMNSANAVFINDILYSKYQYLEDEMMVFVFSLTSKQSNSDFDQSILFQQNSTVYGYDKLNKLNPTSNLIQILRSKLDNAKIFKKVYTTKFDKVLLGMDEFVILLSKFYSKQCWNLNNTQNEVGNYFLTIDKTIMVTDILLDCIILLIPTLIDTNIQSMEEFLIKLVNLYNHILPIGYSISSYHLNHLDHSYQKCCQKSIIFLQNQLSSLVNEQKIKVHLMKVRIENCFSSTIPSAYELYHELHLLRNYDSLDYINIWNIHDNLVKENEQNNEMKILNYFSNQNNDVKYKKYSIKLRYIMIGLNNLLTITNQMELSHSKELRFNASPHLDQWIRVLGEFIISTLKNCFYDNFNNSAKSSLLLSPYLMQVLYKLMRKRKSAVVDYVLWGLTKSLNDFNSLLQMKSSAYITSPDYDNIKNHINYGNDNNDLNQTTTSIDSLLHTTEKIDDGNMKPILFSVGNKVDGLVSLQNGTQRWYPGIISSINEHTNTYTIEYNDGEIGVDVSNENIRLTKQRKSKAVNKTSTSLTNVNNSIDINSNNNNLTEKPNLEMKSNLNLKIDTSDSIQNVELLNVKSPSSNDYNQNIDTETCLKVIENDSNKSNLSSMKPLSAREIDNNAMRASYLLVSGSMNSVGLEYFIHSAKQSKTPTSARSARSTAGLSDKLVPISPPRTHTHNNDNLHSNTIMERNENGDESIKHKDSIEFDLLMPADTSAKAKLELALFNYDFSEEKKNQIEYDPITPYKTNQISSHNIPTPLTVSSSSSIISSSENNLNNSNNSLLYNKTKTNISTPEASFTTPFEEVKNIELKSTSIAGLLLKDSYRSDDDLNVDLKNINQPRKLSKEFLKSSKSDENYYDSDNSEEDRIYEIPSVFDGSPMLKRSNRNNREDIVPRMKFDDLNLIPSLAHSSTNLSLSASLLSAVSGRKNNNMQIQNANENNNTGRSGKGGLLSMRNSSRSSLHGDDNSNNNNNNTNNGNNSNTSNGIVSIANSNSKIRKNMIQLLNTAEITRNANYQDTLNDDGHNLITSGNTRMASWRGDGSSRYNTARRYPNYNYNNNNNQNKSYNNSYGMRNNPMKKGDRSDNYDHNLLIDADEGFTDPYFSLDNEAFHAFSEIFSTIVLLLVERCIDEGSIGLTSMCCSDFDPSNPIDNTSSYGNYQETNDNSVNIIFSIREYFKYSSIIPIKQINSNNLIIPNQFEMKSDNSEKLIESSLVDYRSPSYYSHISTIQNYAQMSFSFDTISAAAPFSPACSSINRLLKLINNTYFDQSCLPLHLHNNGLKIGDGGFGSVFCVTCPESCNKCRKYYHCFYCYRSSHLATPALSTNNNNNNEMKRVCVCWNSSVTLMRRDQSVAIKCVPRERCGYDSNMISNIYNEITCLEMLNDQIGVCDVLDYGVHEDEYWVVLSMGEINLSEWRLQKPNKSLKGMQTILESASTSSRISNSYLPNNNNNSNKNNNINNSLLVLNSDSMESIKNISILSKSTSFIPRPLGIRDVAVFMSLFLDALYIVDGIHKKGITHYDIKANNFMLRSNPIQYLPLIRICHENYQPSGIMFIIDFGEAVINNNNGSIHSKCRGTLPIQSPEMICIGSEQLFHNKSWAELYVTLCLDYKTPPNIDILSQSLSLISRDIKKKIEQIALSALQQQVEKRITLAKLINDVKGLIQDHSSLFSDASSMSFFSDSDYSIFSHSKKKQEEEEVDDNIEIRKQEKII
eukprot:gene6508-8946_t